MSVKGSYFFTCFTVLYVLAPAKIVGAYADAGPCTGSCITHDPSIIRRESDGKWFRFTSHLLIGITIADNIEGPWTDHGAVLAAGSSVIDHAGKADPWAPDVQKHGDYYYCFYAVSTLGSQNSVIGVAISSTMEPGTWTDLGTVLTSTANNEYNAIDPNFITTNDGTMYMVFGSFWHNIFLIKMASPTKVSSEAPVNIVYNNSGIHPVEGSYLYHHADYYYLFFSSGSCCAFTPSLPAPNNEYRINVCRSKNIAGPYVDASGKSCLEGGGTTVYESHGTVYAPGGQGVYDDILYYSYVYTPYGYAEEPKLFGWNKITWMDDWPTVW